MVAAKGASKAEKMAEPKEPPKVVPMAEKWDHRLAARTVGQMVAMLDVKTAGMWVVW